MCAYIFQIRTSYSVFICIIWLYKCAYLNINRRCAYIFSIRIVFSVRNISAHSVYSNIRISVNTKRFFPISKHLVYVHHVHKPKHIFEWQKNVNGRLYLKSILKYFLSIRILGRLTASAEATSVPLSSLSVLPSPLAGWTVRDKGEHHSDNYHRPSPSQFTMSTLCTLPLSCGVQVLARRGIYEHTLY